MRTSFLLSLATLTVVFSALSAQAETLKSANPEAIAPLDAQRRSLPVTAPQPNWATTPAQQVSPITVDSASQPIPGTTLTSATLLAEPSTAVVQADRTMPGTTTPGTTTPGTTTPGTTTPGTTTPGTTTPGTTTPDQITPGTTTPDQTTPGTTTPNTTPSGSSGILPGRATRSGPSYIGIGGNIGLGTGNTAVGEGSFAVFSKLGLSRSFSVRPTILVSDNPTLLIPLTYDLPPIGVPGGAGFSVAPYLGVGAAISFSDDTSADFLATGGIDVPLSPQFTATAAVNVTAFDNTAVGLLIGLGYNFSGF